MIAYHCNIAIELICTEGGIFPCIIDTYGLEVIGVEGDVLRRHGQSHRHQRE